MRKIFFTFSIILVGFVVIWWLYSYSVNRASDFEDFPIEETTPNPPIQFPDSKWKLVPLQTYKDEQKKPEPMSWSGRTLLIGFEGLNWAALHHLATDGRHKNIAHFVARATRAVMNPKVPDYITPEAGWLRVLTGKQSPTDSDLKIWSFADPLRMALLDVPFSKPEDASSGIFFSRNNINDSNRAKNLLELKTGLDFAAEKFAMLHSKDYDLGIVAVNQPDKTQHRAMTGYWLSTFFQDNLQNRFSEVKKIFQRNEKSLEDVYTDLDSLFGYFLENHARDRLIIFSVHGHEPVPMEFRLHLELAWIELSKIQGVQNSSNKIPISTRIGGITWMGSQETRAFSLPLTTVDFAKDGQQELSAQIIYPIWCFQADTFMKKLILPIAVEKMNKRLGPCVIDDDSIFESVIDEDTWVLRPKYESLLKMFGDCEFRYEGSVSVTRVQSGHPHTAKGVFLAYGPGFVKNHTINAVALDDLLPTLGMIFHNRNFGNNTTGQPIKLLD